MISNLSLKTKVMSFVVGIVIVVTAGSTIIISGIIYRQNRDLSFRFLTQSMELIQDEISLIEKRLLTNSHQIIASQELGDNVSFLATNMSDGEMDYSYLSSVKSVVHAIYGVSQAANIWKAAIYTAKNELLCYVVIENDKIRMEIANKQEIQNVQFKVGDSVSEDAWKKNSSFMVFSKKFQHEIPTKEQVRFDKINDYISLVAGIPIKAPVFDRTAKKMVRQQVGFLIAVAKLDDSFVSRLSNLTHTDINIFHDAGFSVGKLPEYDEFNLAMVTDFSPDNAESLTRLDEMNISGRDYFRAIFPIKNHPNVIGAVVLLYTADIAMANTWSIIWTLCIILLVCVILIIPLAYLFSGTFIKPLKSLSETIIGIADSGKFARRVTVKSGDEVGRTAVAFNDLMEALQTAMEAINGVMAAVAEGDLSKRIEGSYSGELENFQIAFNQSIGILSNTIHQVLSAFDQVSSGAHELSHSSKMLADGSTQQAAALEEISSAMNELLMQAKSIHNNATESRNTTSNAIDKGTSGKTQMESMLKSMQSISDTSSEVSKIVKVIDEIAFQTNLLALNAAVEAARAGKYGKGFAVVAEEVRNLATRSAKAANTTTNLIESSLKQVEFGVMEADKSAKILDELIGSIDKSGSLVFEISTASKEQKTGVSEINQGLAQVNNVIQQNTAIAEESASASEDLLSHSDRLQQMLNRFVLSRISS